MLQFTKESKTPAKMINYAQKSENFVVSKARKPSVKRIGDKISLYSIRRKG